MTLQQLSMHNCVRLLWVPGHSNINGNETGWTRKTSRNDGLRWTGTWSGIVSDKIKNKISQWSVQEQNRRSRNIKSCHQAKQFMQVVNIRLAQHAVRLSRKDLRILVGLLTGHNTLNRHLSWLRRMDDPLCPLCKEEEDQPASFRQLLCHRKETMWTLWKASLRTKLPKSKTLEHSSQVC